ncbi:MAG: CDP-glycerol glycerophosphotransferase family protein [Flavobacteriaceae bacterium]|nr:CDP-glycerol glycerophosphotransferase family protein [Flavobacteriaceae bacterium]
MNKYRYNKVRLLLFLIGLPFSIVGLFWKRDKKRIIFNSQNNMQFNQNTKYLFLYFLREKKEYDIRFVINDDDLRAELINKYGDYFIDSMSLKNILYILGAKTWVTSALETPIGGFLHKVRRNVFHLGHGAPLKNVGRGEEELGLLKQVYYRLIKYNFSYFFSTADIFNETWRKCLEVKPEQVVVLGQAKNDRSVHYENEMLTKNLLESGFKHILYAPTWRPYGETRVFPFDDFDVKKLDAFLAEQKVKIHLRLHPDVDDKGIDLTDVENIAFLGADKVSDINELLFSFDMLITDYSSIYIDFLLLEKPQLFLPYDLEIYKEKIGVSVDYDKYTAGPKPTTMQEFMNEIEQLFTDEQYYLEQRKEVNKCFNKYTENIAQINAEFITKWL